LATRVHCSRATIYRYAGGKTQIRETVMARNAARIVDVVRRHVEGKRGAERVLAAVEVAVAEIRSDPAGKLFVESARGGPGTSWLTSSPTIAGLANELAGVADDAKAAAWIVRLVLSLLVWPDVDAASEHDTLVRFVAPAFVETA